MQKDYLKYQELNTKLSEERNKLNNLIRLKRTTTVSEKELENQKAIIIKLEKELI